MKNNQGSAVVWAVCTLMVLLLVLTATLTSSAAYHARSVREIDRNQAYLTARSAVDAVLAELAKHNVGLVGPADDENDADGSLIPPHALPEEEEDGLPLDFADIGLLPEHGVYQISGFSAFAFYEMGEITAASIARIEDENAWLLSITADKDGEEKTVTVTVEIKTEPEE
jgi:hypothetical protein